METTSLIMSNSEFLCNDQFADKGRQTKSLESR